jgi:hypothetical protein
MKVRIEVDLAALNPDLASATPDEMYIALMKKLRASDPWVYAGGGMWRVIDVSEIKEDKPEYEEYRPGMFRTKEKDK